MIGFFASLFKEISKFIIVLAFIFGCATIIPLLTTNGLEGIMAILLYILIFSCTVGAICLIIDTHDRIQSIEDMLMNPKSDSTPKTASEIYEAVIENKENKDYKKELKKKTNDISEYLDSLECPNCGNKISVKDKKCPHCNAVNDNYGVTL